METVIVVILALLLDNFLGEAKRWHPLVGFGRLAGAVEQALYGPDQVSALSRRLRGILALTVLLLPLTALCWLVTQQLENAWLVDIIILYLAIGARSLALHARQVRDALVQQKLESARTYTSYLVSRDTENMSATDMSRATIESTLENGSDAIFAPLFWFIIAGAPGVICYRLANTLDAMWGYRTSRYRYFGCAAARLDDTLNFVPARLTALTYACVGKFSYALRCWRTQAKHYESPNAGPVMASGAGALALQLGGPASYHGQHKNRPLLGFGNTPVVANINQTLALLQRGMLLWIILMIVAYGVYSLA